jgi:hypothetical protein
VFLADKAPSHARQPGDPGLRAAHAAIPRCGARRPNRVGLSRAANEALRGETSSQWWAR